MNLEFSTDPAVWLALAVATIAALVGIWTRFLPIWAVGNPPEEPDEDEEAAKRGPLLSVIVYSFIEQEELDTYLDALAAQDYEDFEVIIVNEGSAESTMALSEHVASRYDHRFYVTFIPHDAHSLSRRKLAYTIGIKAAHGDVILTTASNYIIPSNSWLSGMMTPFRTDSLCEIVLGYTHIDFDEMRGAGKWYRQMDATLTACQWIGQAMLGSPYRGDCFNLAYRRERFFEQKGYARTIHLTNGDDDIFLRPFMDGYNTSVVVSPDTILTARWGDSANRILSETKERYQFTASLLPAMPFVRAGIGSLMQWLTLIAAAGAAVAGLPSFMATIVAVVFLIVVWTTQILVYRRAARRLESVCLWWSFPFFLLWLPFGNLIFRLRHRHQRRKNYTFA